MEMIASGPAEDAALRAVLADIDDAVARLRWPLADLGADLRLAGAGLAWSSPAAGAFRRAHELAHAAAVAAEHHRADAAAALQALVDTALPDVRS